MKANNARRVRSFERVTMKSRKTTGAAVLVAGVAVAYGGWLAYLAYFDLVTLDVRNMEVREVVKKMERQTWESIFVDEKVEGEPAVEGQPEAAQRSAGDGRGTNVIAPNGRLSTLLESQFA